ncbi:WD repeat protein [Coccidioides immitis RS]|uniref:WD repeat protein n=2 Tax=Coccidioides immitis TaxID=5501 RepID=J3KJQ8_COCIM|nr:WD repeat protein [Coccidioides immitis RS]EAS36336.3 WD repeat protein [Coccidioides immitis RS]KMP01685.1 hypothetical protein CIRG_01824 [Coccidioides immitis RMSCC 2394]
MLQRAWNSDPQRLPFAPYIKTHALVTLIQKGLQYYDIEKSLDQNGNPISVSDVSFFGPSTAHPSIIVGIGDSVKAKDAEMARKPEPASEAFVHAAPKPDGEINGQSPKANIQPIAKKGAEASEPEGLPIKVDDAAMELDKHEQAGEPSPAPLPSLTPTEGVVDADGDVGMIEMQEQEPQTPVFTLTTGQSVGVQISPVKAADLGPDTTLVDVSGESHMMRAAWRPHDPLVFAAAGDTFCGLWKLSGQRSPTFPTHTTLVAGSCVTAIDWDSTGNMLAVATYDNFIGSITIYDNHGNALDVLPESPRLISGLRWSGKGSQIAIVASDGQRSELFLWNQESRPDSFVRPQAIDGPVYDVAWCTNDHIYACGDGSVYQCDIDGNIQLSKTFDSGEEPESWTLLKAVSIAEKPVAVAASTSTSHIWIPTHDIHVKFAHHGDITGLEIRPRPNPSESLKNSPLILATSSMDDTVKLWNVDLDSKEIYCQYRLFLGAVTPALAVSFSPDGYAIAAASYNNLTIWNADRGGTPMATWDGYLDKSNDEANHDKSIELDPSSVSMMDRPLSWDTDGKKLALGFGGKVAIINLQR